MLRSRAAPLGLRVWIWDNFMGLRLKVKGRESSSLASYMKPKTCEVQVRSMTLGPELRPGLRNLTRYTPNVFFEPKPEPLYPQT